MQLVKSSNLTSVTDSDIIEYSLSIINNNTSQAFTLVITDTVPECTTFIPGSVTINGTPQPSANIQTGIPISSLPSNGVLVVKFKVQVNSNCSTCTITNVANLRFSQNGIQNSIISNVLVIKKVCTPTIENCDPFLDKYVIPGPLSNSATELVILTDEVTSSGILTLPGNTLALTGEAIQLLNKAFNINYPSKISDLNPNNHYNISALLFSLNKSGIISLSDTAPSVTNKIDYPVATGDTINPNPSSAPSILKPILAPYPGLTICISIDGYITIYIYFSSRQISSINCTQPQVTGYNAISNFGPLGYTIYPEPVSSSLASSCGSCGVCGICGGCALCGPSPILGAASAASLSVISLASLSISSY